MAKGPGNGRRFLVIDNGRETGVHAGGIKMTNDITHDRIMQLAIGFWASKTFLSAVELGVFGAFADGPLELTQLRSRLGLHERSAHDFFDALVALGMLRRDDAGRYSNSEEAELFLNPAKPGYVGGLIEMFNARLYGFWGSLTEALRTGEPQNEAKQGGDLFGTLYADPERLEGFLRAMTGQALPVAHALAGSFPWGDVRTVVDVGTAQGCVPVALALAHPHLAGGGFDLPPVEPDEPQHADRDKRRIRLYRRRLHRMAARRGIYGLPRRATGWAAQRGNRDQVTARGQRSRLPSVWPERRWH
jgi:hypothetical protein